jgi:hypothetical protein
MQLARRPLLPLIALIALVASIALALPSTADARPRISSFYVKDEGSRIHMRVNYCDFTGELSDSYSSTFRIWDENSSSSIKVFDRRVSGRIYDYCGWASYKIADTFANGLYSANVAVTNRTTGTFIRIAARYFIIS